MKKKTTTLFLFFLMALGYVKSQTTAGNLMVGGGVTFYSESDQSDEDYDFSYTNFGPGAGYFIMDNLAVGLNLSFQKTKEDNGGSSEERTEFMIGPFARYYIPTSNESFAFFGQARLDFGSGKRDVTPGGEVKSGSLSFAISPGFAYFFNQHWALEIALTGLVIESDDPNKDADDDKVTSVMFSVESLTPSIGVRYHFGI
jgi:outer membrane protein